MAERFSMSPARAVRPRGAGSALRRLAGFRPGPGRRGDGVPGGGHLPDQAEVLRHAEAWRPFRMWALVLLHVWIRGPGGGMAPRSRRGGGRRG